MTVVTSPLPAKVAAPAKATVPLPARTATVPMKATVPGSIPAGDGGSQPDLTVLLVTMAAAGCAAGSALISLRRR